MISSQNPKIAVVILAAGSSSRMNGEAKQLLEFEGVTLLRRAAETALRAEFYSTVVVLGANHENARKQVEDLPVKIAFNENWKSGISLSIEKGLSLFSEEEPDAVIFMLCDQPLVTSEHLRRLRDAFSETKKPIAACRYEKTIGVPALFAREVFGELTSLTADEGAKKIIVKNLDRTTLIDLPEAALDVDTRLDFEKLTKASLQNK